MNFIVGNQKHIQNFNLFLTIPISFFIGCSIFGGGEKGLKHAEEYRVQAPKTWKTVDREQSDQAYQLQSGNIVSLTSSCERDSKAPLSTLTRHLLFGTRNIQFEKQEKLEVQGHEGLLSQVRASIEDKPFHLLLVVIPIDGCIFDFSLISPNKIPERDTDEMMEFIKSLNYGTN